MIDLQHSIKVAQGEMSAPSNDGETVAVECDIETSVLPTVVKNGGFEGNYVEVAYWEQYGDDVFTVDETFKSGGDQSIKITNGGAKQWIALNHFPAASEVTIKGYSKAVGTTVGERGDYSIYADVQDSNQTLLQTFTAKFPGGTHDFVPSEETFELPPGAVGMNLYTMYRNDAIITGVAYFDDISVSISMP